MNLFALAGLLMGVACLSLSIATLIKGHKPFHYMWSLFCLAAATWGFGGYMIATATTAESAIFWWRMAYIGVIMMPTFLISFIHSFLQIKKYVFLTLLYLVTTTFLIMNLWGAHFINSVKMVFGEFYYITSPSEEYNTLVFVWLAQIVYSTVILSIHYRLSSGFLKEQIKYIFFGIYVGFFGGAFAFLPVYNINLYPVPSVISAFAPIIIFYAILRYRLMDIKLILKRGTVLALLFALVFLILSDGFSFFEKILPRNISGPILVFSIILIFVPLKNLLEKIMDRFFFKNRISPEEMIAGLNQVLLINKNEEELLKHVLFYLYEMFKVKKAAVANLTDKGTLNFLSSVGIKKNELPKLKNPSAIIKYFSHLLQPAKHDKYKEIVEREELAFDIDNDHPEIPLEQKITWVDILNELNYLDFSVCFPIFLHNEISALFFLDRKLSERPYSFDDLDFLHEAMHQIPVAIHKLSLQKEATN